jgi:hypothetical protein
MFAPDLLVQFCPVLVQSVEEVLPRLCSLSQFLFLRLRDEESAHDLAKAQFCYTYNKFSGTYKQFQIEKLNIFISVS